MTPRVGIIEWVPGTVPLKTCLDKQLKKSGQVGEGEREGEAGEGGGGRERQRER